MDLANKYLKETERQMKSLERAGKTNSSAYQELKATYETTKNEIADYNERIIENSSLIDKNNEVIERSLKQLKLEEMTMSQLKKPGKGSYRSNWIILPWRQILKSTQSFKRN